MLGLNVILGLFAILKINVIKGSRVILGLVVLLWLVVILGWSVTVKLNWMIEISVTIRLSVKKLSVKFCHWFSAVKPADFLIGLCVITDLKVLIDLIVLLGLIVKFRNRCCEIKHLPEKMQVVVLSLWLLLKWFTVWK